MSSIPSGRPSASLTNLQNRALLKDAAREFFRSRGFWEVETPLLSRDCCIDQWLDPFPVDIAPGEQFYLQTSPEFAMKRLLCAGADRIFEITRSFRQHEIGERHNPEFTMIEWYQQNCDHHDQMNLVEALVLHLMDLSRQQGWFSPDRTPLTAIRRLSYEQAFHEVIGLSPHTASLQELTNAARQASSAILPQGIEKDRDGLLNLLLAECIEPRLAQQGGVFVYDYPESQSALAKVRPGSPPVAERFELYLDGVEICNGYHELTDADELRERMRLRHQMRQRDGKRPIPIESQLLAAMAQGMPECSGVALGFDRLAMWCLGLTRISDVIAFPFDRA